MSRVISVNLAAIALLTAGPLLAGCGGDDDADRSGSTVNNNNNGSAGDTGKPVDVQAQLESQGFDGSHQLTSVETNSSYHLYPVPNDGHFVTCEATLVREDRTPGSAYSDFPITSGSRVFVAMHDENRNDLGAKIVDLARVTPDFLLSDPVFNSSNCGQPAVSQAAP